MNTFFGIAQMSMKTNQLLLLFPAIKRFLFRTVYISNTMTRTQVYPLIEALRAVNISFSLKQIQTVIRAMVNGLCKGHKALEILSQANRRHQRNIFYYLSYIFTSF